MRKSISMILSVLVCLTVFSGCGETVTADTNMVYVNKKGVVTSVDVGELDQSYYSKEELEAFVEDELEAYTAANGEDTVSLKELSVENSTAKLILEYETVEDYTGFNGIELYQGKVVKALADGYEFDADFYKVEDGVLAGSAAAQDIYGDSSYKTVIIKANNISVKVAGEICYVSGEDVQITGSDTVSIQQEGTSEDSFETDIYTYIIYK